MKIIFFHNGNTAVFDEKGEQVPELQQSWLLMYAKFLKKKGIDPTGQDIEIELPDRMKAQIFKVPGGYNWQIL